MKTMTAKTLTAKTLTAKTLRRIRLNAVLQYRQELEARGRFTAREIEDLNAAFEHGMAAMLKGMRHEEVVTEEDEE